MVALVLEAFGFRFLVLRGDFFWIVYSCYGDGGGRVFLGYTFLCM